MAEIPDISLRYWAGARAAAGREVEVYRAETIAAALAAARAQHADPHFDRVLGVCSLLVDGIVVTGGELSRRQDASIEVEVLPPFAGGATRTLSHHADTRLAIQNVGCAPWEWHSRLSAVTATIRWDRLTRCLAVDHGRMRSSLCRSPRM